MQRVAKCCLQCMRAWLVRTEHNAQRDVTNAPHTSCDSTSYLRESSTALTACIDCNSAAYSSDANLSNSKCAIAFSVRELLRLHYSTFESTLTQKPCMRPRLP
eukprot:9596-Heterococcus_DN1.PRE.1